MKEIRRLVHRAGGKLGLGGQKSTPKLIESGCCDVMFDSMKQLVDYVQATPAANQSSRTRK